MVLHFVYRVILYDMFGRLFNLQLLYLLLVRIEPTINFNQALFADHYVPPRDFRSIDRYIDEKTKIINLIWDINVYVFGKE